MDSIHTAIGASTLPQTKEFQEALATIQQQIAKVTTEARQADEQGLRQQSSVGASAPTSPVPASAAGKSGDSSDAGKAKEADDDLPMLHPEEEQAMQHMQAAAEQTNKEAEQQRIQAINDAFDKTFPAKKESEDGEVYQQRKEAHRRRYLRQGSRSPRRDHVA